MTKLLGASTPDPVIVKIADERSLVIVTWNRKHFNRHTGRKKGGAPTFTRFGLITFDCPESMGVERVRAEIVSVHRRSAALGAALSRLSVNHRSPVTECPAAA